MKTITKNLGRLLLSCFLLISFAANAQFTHFPTYNAPLNNNTSQVAHGLLDNLDQRTSPIWFKVNGNMAGSQPHNKMMIHNATPTINYVLPGSKVDVNFNINRNSANRYTLVSYTVDAATGVRTIYDYQSNFYNANTPVQGNSNQQLVLIPTCQYEVYFIKGAPVTEFTGTMYASGTVYNPNLDAGNPFANDLDNVITDPTLDNRIIEYAYGGTGTCDDCPIVLLPNPDYECVYPRLLEVIDLPNGDKELIFSVVNTINTSVTSTCGTGWPEIGDILFTNIIPTPNTPNQPYSFRYNYQLGPQIAGYTLPPTFPAQPISPPAPPYQGAFVFDQRNNHNVLDFDVYQSEIVRFTVTEAEYIKLSDPNYTGATPQICIELSNKHPEPHQTLPPVYCFNIDFVCEPVCPSEGDCERFDCAFHYLQGSTPLYAATAQYAPDLTITNTTGKDIISVTFKLPLLTAAEITALNPLYSTSDEFDAIGVTTFTTSTFSDATNTYLVFTQVGDNWAQFEDASFTFLAPQAKIDAVSGLLPVTVFTTDGSYNQTFDLFSDNCPIIPLPVELISFTGKAVNEGVALNWKTASEKNNDRFEIERSADGKNFEKLGTLKGQGNTSALTTYNFVDKQPLKGLNYYRLNQVDFDGTNAYSQVIKVNSEKRSTGLAVQMIPNPCSDQSCSIILQGADASKALTVEMRDLTGRLIFSQQLPGDQGSFNLPKAGIGKGIYILSAKNGLNYTYQKVIIQ